MQRQEYIVIAYLGIVIRKIGHNKYYYLDKIQTIAFDTFPSKNEMSILTQFSPSAHLVHI